MSQLQLTKTLISSQMIQDRINDLGKTITQDYQDKESLVCISILKGSFVFAADLVRKINHPNLTMEFMAVSSYGNSTESSGTVQILLDLKKDIAGKHVLIMEDLIDSGLTMQYLINLLQQRAPASIRVCCLLRKYNPDVKVQLDYCGFRVSKDDFVVGYGMDYAEKYRNLDYVAVL